MNAYSTILTAAPPGTILTFNLSQLGGHADNTEELRVVQTGDAVDEITLTGTGGHEFSLRDDGTHGGGDIIDGSGLYLVIEPQEDTGEVEKLEEISSIEILAYRDEQPTEDW